MTDPAHEIADLCGRLASSTNKHGESYLATCFNVEAWSREFYEIIFSIAERCYFLSDLVEQLDFDQDFRTEARDNIMEIRSAFDADSLRTGWSAVGKSARRRQDVGRVDLQ